LNEKCGGAMVLLLCSDNVVINLSPQGSLDEQYQKQWVLLRNIGCEEL